MPSLYRKWRSRSFDDLLGQEHVVRTLRNAVRQRRVAHAYLFTGPRGTGKTSTARILAKAVNCLAPEDGNPCNRCEACIAADEGRAIDVIEIDAASNTSVDNVRDLRERVAYAAGEGRYKVYIVDEVHRLSGAAFDAFLKTLEEPPPHVIFVFASTEPHKVPATIGSRCQRFDFRRITPSITLARLRSISEQEGLSVSEGALELIALQAGGSLRDAVGLLDQVTSYSSGRIEETDVRDSLGLADPHLIARLTEHLLSGDVGRGLGEADQFILAGGDPGQLVRQLVDYWRALLLVTTRAQSDRLEFDPVLASHLEGHAARLEEQQILGMLRAITSGEFSSRYNVPASLPFEVGYVQAHLLVQPPTGPIIARVSPPAVTEAQPPASTILVPKSEMDSSTPPSDAAPAGPSADASSADGSSVPPAPARAAADGALDDTWSTIVSNMRRKSSSLQAVLRSGYLMEIASGAATIGFLHEFHHAYFGDVKKRRVLEEVVSDTLGSAYRVKCVRVTKEEIEAARGANAVDEDDGFIEEAAGRLREYHMRQLNGGTS